MTTPRPRLVTPALLCLFLAASGCSSDKHTNVVPDGSDGQIPSTTPINDTEAHLLTRFEATFEYQDQPEYTKLLTNDFRFHFSISSDPTLVALYGENWTRVEESAAATHLFQGFQNSVDVFVPAASKITIMLNGIQPEVDPNHADSTQYYKKMVVSTVDMQIEIPPDQLYAVASRQEFYFVRGDAAVLAPGQAPQSDRWYLRGWDDLTVSPYPGKGTVVNPGNSTSVGSIKSAYLQ